MAHHIYHRYLFMSSSNPYQSILDILGDGGFLWVHDYGTDATIGNGVSSWNDVTDTVTLVRPGAASKSPTRTADGIDFDGVDDVVWIETLPSGFDSYLSANGAVGGTIGFSSVEVGTGTGAGDRALTIFNGGNLYQSYVVGTFQLNQAAFPSYFALANNTVGLVTYTLPFGTFLPGSRWIDSTENEGNPARWGAGWTGMTRMVVGADYQATNNFWDGKIGAIWMTPRQLNDAEIATLNAALTAAGY